jgi:tRNA modification GTPase
MDRLPKDLRVISICNKVDLLDSANVSRGTSIEGRAELEVSAKTGRGIDELRRRLLRIAGWTSGGEGAFLARERHLVALAEAAGHLTAAEKIEGQYELFAEELRLAQRALSRITGEFTPDDLLGEIFSNFCIGK